MSDLSFLSSDPETGEPIASEDALSEAISDRTLGEKMLKGYFSYYQDDLKRYIVLFVERYFERSLLRHPGPRGRKNPANAKWNHGGVVDLAVIDSADGRLLGFDHKSFESSFYSAVKKTYLLDDQITGYFDASPDLLAAVTPPPGVSFAGRSFDGFVHNVLIKRAPHPPELLKKGGLSKAKAQDTTPELYREAIKALSLNPADYADILLHLEQNRKTYFERTVISRSPDEREAWRRESWIKADEMRKGYVYKNPNPIVCQNCAYRMLCERETPEGLELFETRDERALNEEIKVPRIEPKKLLYTFSRASGWSQCRKKDEFEYRRGLRPRTRARYFRFGDVLHKALATWYVTKNDELALKAFAEEWGKEFVRIGGTLSVIDELASLPASSEVGKMDF